MRIFYVAAFLASLVGVALGLVAYAAPFDNTGVNGTPGALLALVGALATAAGTLVVILFPAARHRLSSILNVLVPLAAALTALAAYFLMQTGFAIAMVVALLGLLLAIAYSPSRRAA